MRLVKQGLVTILLAFGAGTTLVSPIGTPSSSTLRPETRHAKVPELQVFNESSEVLSRNATKPTVIQRGTQSARKFQQVDELSLSAKRAACLRAAKLTPSDIGFTCNTSLLVHYSLMEFWTHHASLRMCQNRRAFGKVMECVLDATKGCLPPENRRHFPDKRKAKRGLNYICGVGQTNKFDVNISCAQSHFPEVFKCVHRDILLVVGDTALHTPIQPHLICRTYDIADLCCWEKLQVCGKETAAAYTRLMSLYLRPPSCSTAATRTAESLSVFVLSLLLGSFARL